MLGSVVGRDGLITHRPTIGGVTLGCTPRARSVAEGPFWTLWNREDYGRVTAARGVPQRDGSVALRLSAGCDTLGSHRRRGGRHYCGVVDEMRVISFHGASSVMPLGEPDEIRRAMLHRATLPLQVAAAAHLAGLGSLRNHALGNFERRAVEGTLFDPSGERPD